MIPMVILGRRHGVNRTDDPVVIAGPTFAHGALLAQFKRDFCQSRQHPDFEEVWLSSVIEDKRVKFTTEPQQAPKVEFKKEKKK